MSVSSCRINKQSNTGRLRPPTKIASAKFTFECQPPASVLESTDTKTLKRKIPATTKVSSSKTAVNSLKKAPIAPRNTLKPRNDTLNPTLSSKTANEDQQGPPKKKKRPAWDVKGRLQNLEEFNNNTEARFKDATSMIDDLNAKLAENQTTISNLNDFKTSLETQVIAKDQENGEINKELLQLRQKLQDISIHNESNLKKIQDDFDNQKTSLQADICKLQTENSLISNNLETIQKENNQLKDCISSQSASSLIIETQLSSTKTHLDMAKAQITESLTVIEDFKCKMTDYEKTIKELENRLQDEEIVRRKLHNTIQELKGNIRVFCRIRPILDSESSKTENISHIKFDEVDSSSLVLNQVAESASGNAITKEFPFSFDKVFPPQSTQADVFDEISQLVQSALDGYNVSIFAYGQTGSGKTFTMEGPDVNEFNDANIGMIPRAVDKIYSCSEKLKEKGWEFEIEGQYLEIYNETIRDLIGTSDPTKKYEIKHIGHQGKTHVTDINIVKFTNPAQVQKMLLKASENRAVASTNCNERSSRSHSVFTLRLSGKNTVTNEILEGTLNLIDLAGSERLSSSGSTGERLKETQAINKSLSSLGDVITALSNKDAHVPYRNSKLTYLLQNSLGGNSKTLMFVNVSPLMVNFQESLCSLRFATKVNTCQIGTAKRVSK